MRLKEKNLLKKFAATLKKFRAKGAKKVEYGIYSKHLDRYSVANYEDQFQTISREKCQLLHIFGPHNLSTLFVDGNFCAKYN